MHRQWTQAAGFLAIFLMPTLFLVGAILERTWLAFGVVALLFPLARTVFGAVPPSAGIEWREGPATFLDRLPLVFVPVLVVCVIAGLAAAEPALRSSPGAAVGLGFSLWMTLLLATCPAHELIHRRDRHQAMLGYVLAGICGYPALGMEHLAHHARPGDTSRPEYPLKAESVWQFAARRLGRICAESFGPGAPVWNPRASMTSLVRMRVAMGATVATLAGFAAIAGWQGAVLYLFMMVGVAFGVQLITYLQHWGLGDDNIPERIAFGRGWEEDCQFQAWITLKISLHDEHHRNSRRPYYQLELAPDSPRLPAGYVLLMFAALVPPIWRRMMEPALAHWLAKPASPLSAGRRLTCFGLHGT